MKVFSTCPSCNEVLLSEELTRGLSLNLWRKSCEKKINHGFYMDYHIDDDQVYLIRLKINIMNKYVFVYFKLNDKILTIGNRDSRKNISLPYFEPNLSNYKSLVDKLKLYITFS